MARQCFVLAHTRRLTEAEKDAKRRLAKQKERENDAKAKLEAAVGRHAEKACLFPFSEGHPMLARACQCHVQHAPSLSTLHADQRGGRSHAPCHRGWGGA